MKNLENNETDGKISRKAGGNIRTAIDWLLVAAKNKTVKITSDNTKFDFKINFLTLTLSSKQEHTDQEIKSKVLNYFLERLRANFGLKNYVWRAEAQANGNIHFHIVTDIFIHHTKLRDEWNRAQNRLGYIDRFKAKQGHDQPNSTDVHSIRKLRNVAGYLAKYCSKNLFYIKSKENPIKILKRSGINASNIFRKVNKSDLYCAHDLTRQQIDFLKDFGIHATQPRKIKGRQWFLSKVLQGVKSLKLYLDDVRDEFDKFSTQIQHHEKKFFDYCTLIKKNIYSFMTSQTAKISGHINNFIECLRMPNDHIVYEV